MLYYYQLAAVNSSGTSPYTSPLSVVPAQSGLLSLGQVRTMVRQRADMENSQFVSDSELNTYITQSQYELYDILITAYEDYNVYQPILFTFNGNANQYPLPDGLTTFMTQAGGSITPPPFYKLLGVDCGLALNNNAWVTLHKFEFIQRNRFVYPNVTSTFLGVFNLRYRVTGNTIYFIPTPSGAQYARIWYIPRLITPLKDTDLLDGISGWTEYVIIDAAIKAMQKEESDVTVLALQKQAIIDRIQTAAQNRDAGSPDKISDTRAFGGNSGNYGSPGGDGGYGGY